MKFLKNSSEHSLFNDDSIQINEVLPAGFYILKFHNMKGFYLEESVKFSVPKEIYGNTYSQMNRIINTYNSRKLRPVNTGVMLEGKKGTGKSLVMKMVCLELYNQGLPIISITQNFSGDAFTSFISSITQEACFVFDEFEKFYNNKSSNDNDDESSNDTSLLSLLDGTFTSNKLFLMTVNNIWSVGQFLKNRPGRIYYRFSFGDLDADFIREYCQKNLDNKEWVESVVKIAMVTSGMTFDVLQAIVEESNRYNETPTEVVKYINAMRDSESFDQRYNIEVYEDGKLIIENGNNELTVNCNDETPLTSMVSGHFYQSVVRGDLSIDQVKKSSPDIVERNEKYPSNGRQGQFFFWNDAYFNYKLLPTQIENIDTNGNICYTYLNYKIVLKPIKTTSYTYDAF